MDRAGNQLLAGARFAHNEDCCGALRYGWEFPDGVKESRGLPNKLRQSLSVAKTMEESFHRTLHPYFGDDLFPAFVE